MYDDYFLEYEPRTKFKKEFVSLWDGWLGDKNYSKLDEVTEAEWAKFNSFILLISEKHRVGVANFEMKSIEFPLNISETFSDYEGSMSKSSSEFSTYIIPDLNCMISEEWDYTYIIWHQSSNSLKTIIPLVQASGLYNFSD